VVVSKQDCARRARRALRNVPTDHESAMTDKTAKAPPSGAADNPHRRAPKRVSLRKPSTRRRKPTHDEISVRAYFISLEAPESDELDNWLRAERELKAA